MNKIEELIKEKIESWIEWKLYKILYIGILVPLLFDEAKKWLFQDIFVSIVFFATMIILLLPIIFKGLDIMNIIKEIGK